MIILDDLAQPAPDPVKRDRWGRYLIPDPVTGKARGWTRATTVAKTLDDSTALTAWAKRQVALGVAAKAHIAAGIVAAGATDKRRLDQLVEDAMVAAGSNERRELGTALHRILELVDTGRMAIDDVPDPWAADVRAYRAALDAAGLEVVPDLCEAVLLNHPLEVAGTCDRILRDRHGRLVIADIKTGGFVGWLSFACQFALYATSTHRFDPVAEVLTSMPDVRQDVALMLHVPAGDATCDVVGLSVPVGMDAALMALEVRRIRQRDKRDHIRVDDWDAPPAVDGAVRTVRHDFGIAARPAPAAGADEPMMSDKQQADLKARAAALDPQARALLDAIAKEASAEGRPFSLGAGPTLVRWHVYRALLRLGAHYGADLTAEHVRATVAMVLADAAYPGVRVGFAIGSMDIDEAQAFVRAAIAVISAEAPTIHIDDTGTVRWAGVDNQAA